MKGVKTTIIIDYVIFQSDDKTSDVSVRVCIIHMYSLCRLPSAVNVMLHSPLITAKSQDTNVN